MGDDHSGLIPKPKAGAAPNEIAVADFFDCKTKTLTVGPNAPGWVTFSMVFNGPSFVQDESGKVAIKIKLPKSDAQLPTSVKGGKLHVDTRAAQGAEAAFPQVSGQKVKDKAQEIERYVEGLNAILNDKGHQFGGVTVKDGKLTLTKVALPAPGKADEKKDEKGIKGGPFPHVPKWEKVGAAGLLGFSVLFGIAFMDAGDETGTRTEKVCPEVGGPGESVGAGIDCPETGSDVNGSVPAQGLAQLVRVVSITPEGGDPASGAVEPSNEQNKIFLELPLFMIGERDTVELLDKRNATLDMFTFTVPSKQGLAPPVTTERGGTVMCLIDHENPIPPGRSGADCQYTEPVTDAATPPTPDDSEPVVPESREVEEDTEGKPWSLLAIPGAVLGLAGGLALEEERRRREGDIPIGQDDDGIGPPPKLKDVKAAGKVLTAQTKAGRAFTLRFVLDKIKDVNAGRKYKDIVGTNCSFCALATELTLSGKPASAPPQSPHPTPLKWWKEKAVNTFGTQPGIYKSVGDVTKVLDIWGDGNRAILLMYRPDGTGHAINVVNMGGHVLYIDGQSGKEFTNFGGYSEFMLIRTTK